MIIKQSDIDEFIEQYSDYQTSYQYLGENEKDDLHENEFLQFILWLKECPHVVLAAGLHEYSYTNVDQLHRRLVETNTLYSETIPMFRNIQGTWLIPSHISWHYEEPWPAFTHGDLKQMLALELSGDEDDQFEVDRIFDMPSGVLPSAKTIVESLEKLLIAPKPDPTLFVSPRLWTPHRQNEEANALQSTAVSLINSIKSEGLDLKSINWKQFEEIVAELLRQKGMEISVNRHVPQGGRDIIARGSLIPGSELVTVAVEVKHREYVDRPMIQQSLYQNRVFPALMFVTSGKFSAGVIQEARLPENRMRLFLKDGVAIRDLIKCYRL